MLSHLPEDKYRITLSIDDYVEHLDFLDRRLYLCSPIESGSLEFGMSMSSQIVDSIMQYNREDKDIEPSQRKPIRLYINSPGGDLVEGFSIVSAIEI